MAIKFAAERAPAKKSAKPKTAPPVRRPPRPVAAETKPPATTLADLQTPTPKKAVAAASMGKTTAPNVAIIAKKPREKADGGKKLTSLRLDNEVLEGFKLGGKGWQGRINTALRLHLGLPMGSKPPENGGASV